MLQNNSDSLVFNFGNDLLFATGIESVQYSVVNQGSGNMVAHAAQQLNETAIQVSACRTVLYAYSDELINVGLGGLFKCWQLPHYHDSAASSVG